MAPSDPESERNLDSDGEFDALDLEEDSWTGLDTLRRPGSATAAPNHAGEEFAGGHQLHTCGTCRHWDLLKPQSRSGYMSYIFRGYDELRRPEPDTCAFANLCRLYVSSFPDGGKIFIGLKMDAGTGAPALGSRVDFELYADRSTGVDTIFSGFIHTGPESLCGCSRKLLRSRPSQDALTWVRTKIQLCKETHPRCSAQDAIRPLRLVQIHSPRQAVLYTPGADEAIHYAALSYCWGGPQEYATTRANYADRSLTGMLVEEMSKTVREAIDVCLQLGLKYLWADCLCIIQDNEDDKEEQISQMPRIYSAADVTIAASCGRSVRDGFLESWSPLRVFRFSLAGQTHDVHIAVLFEMARKPEPLDTRAWALQERVLSKRVLDFQTESLVMECSTSAIRYGDGDTGHGLTYHRLKFSDLSDKGFINNNKSRDTRWRDLVVEYTRRHLSMPDDRLLAISGLASLIGSCQVDNRYFAGIWGSALPRDLFWYSVNPQPRPRTSRAPTWSWAAVDGPISFEKSSLHESGLRMKVHGASVIPNHPAARYGDVMQGGYLCVTTLMRGVAIHGSGLERKLHWQESPMYTTLQVYWDTSDDDSTTAFLLNCNMHNSNGLGRVAEDIYTLGLVVASIPGSDRGFRRLGMYDLGRKSRLFGECGQETIYLY